MRWFRTLTVITLLATVLLIAVLLWPPTRRRMHRMVDEKLAPIHEHLVIIRRQHEEAQAHREKTVQALARFHEHLGITDKKAPAKKAPAKKAPAKEAP